MARRAAIMVTLLLWAAVTVSISASARPGPDATGNPAKAASAGGKSGWCAYVPVAYLLTRLHGLKRK
jgi:hypothetical protein